MSAAEHVGLLRRSSRRQGFSDIDGLALRDRSARSLAPERQLDRPTTDRRDKPAKHELRSEAHRACRSEPNGDLTPDPLSPHDLATDDAATRFGVHHARIWRTSRGPVVAESAIAHVTRESVCCNLPLRENADVAVDIDSVITYRAAGSLHSVAFVRDNLPTRSNQQNHAILPSS